MRNLHKKQFYMSILTCAAKNRVVSLSEPLYFDGDFVLSYDAGQDLLYSRVSSDTYDLILRDDNPRYFVLYKNGIDLLRELSKFYQKHKEQREKWTQQN